MGKRLQRFIGASILNHKKQLLHTELHVILRDKSTYHGVIVSFTESDFRFCDYRNHTHTFLLSSIEEIIIDHVVIY